jgi:squalene-hopene/tetraprenyl-beta-curcumene cyclase
MRFEDRYHQTDVFQRALIADALCDADLLLRGYLQPIIDYEVNYLESRHLVSGVGGWSYFPTVPEVPPDADDLGQVMQVLLHCGYKEKIRAYCELPLNVLLHDNVHPDGSFETWIIPAANRTQEQERQMKWSESMWGIGPHNEVIANLLYALVTYDSEQFFETVQRGVTYLETQQKADGSWISRWYYGPYYGTYVCLRLLAVVRPDSHAVHRALCFLHQSQRSDDGWGLEGMSDPLSTSLALLGLASIQRRNDVNNLDRVVRALVYLQNAQQSDGGWPHVQFICPKEGKPYSSRTVTGLYVLKAAVAWHRLTASTGAF